MSGGRAEAARAWTAPLIAAVLVFGGHLALGANATSLALGLCAVWFAFLAVLLAAAPWARRALQRARLGLVGAPFACVLVLAILSLTPAGVGGPQPIWRQVPGALATVSLDPYATLVQIVLVLALAAAFVAGVALGADEERARRTLRSLLLLGMAYGAWAFADHAISPALLFGAPRPFEPDRLSASFGSANTAATLFGALTLLGLVDLSGAYRAARPGGAFQARDLQRLAPALVRPLIALALAATCLVLTQSRAGMLATAAVGVALVGALAITRARTGAVAAPLVGAGALAAGLALASVALNLGALQQRFSFLRADALARGQVFAAHWAAVQAAPWSGYGLGGFAHVNAMIMNRTDAAALASLGAAHDVYLQWLEQAGALGAAAMFATVALAAALLAAAAIGRRRLRAWRIGIGAVLALFLVHGASDYALEVPSMALFLSLLLGLGVGAPPSPLLSRRAAAPGGGGGRGALAVAQ